MINQIVGRVAECATLASMLESNKAEFLAVYGRRRIGKTYLVKNYYKEHLAFEFTGTQNANVKNQVFKFHQKLQTAFGDDAVPTKAPETWPEALHLLKLCLIPRLDKKQVVFLDELPWIASPKSNFLEELAYFWNDWAAEQRNLILVVCGSAAAWMLQKVVSSKGGLHNRLTQRMQLRPFTLLETRDYLRTLGVTWDDYHIIQFYMAVGGVPAYLNGALPHETVTQTLDRLFFGAAPTLRNEFSNLYEALFYKHQNHISVIKALSTKWRGLSRQEIISASGLPDGGGINQVLEELEAASFITRFKQFGKANKLFLYRLTDEYSLFYLKFIADKAHQPAKQGEWMRMSEKEPYKIWCGYAFESICLKHVFAIEQALGVAMIHTESSAYYHKSDDATNGIQVDLLIDRADKAINLCEIKFYSSDFAITHAFSEQMRQRRERFKAITQTRKLVFNTLITTWQVKQITSGQIDQCITMSQLFV
jgi:uncharacterized protein